MDKPAIDPFAPPPIDPKELERARRELGVGVRGVEGGSIAVGGAANPSGGIFDALGDGVAAVLRLARRRTAEHN